MVRATSGTETPAKFDAAPTKWAESQRLGKVTELAVLSPVKRGLVPGENRSYEERLRGAIANLARRHAQGIPVELDRVSTIHFGRMILLRPEQFRPSERPSPAGRGGRTTFATHFDEYEEIGDQTSAKLPPSNEASQSTGDSSMLLTLVEFDGELRPYMREISQFLGDEFNTIFENCQEFPGTEDFELFWSWIRTFQISTDLFYATYRDISVVRIKQLELFKRRFDDFVARVRSPAGERRGSMDELFDDFLLAEQQYAVGFPYPGGTYANADASEGG